MVTHLEDLAASALVQLGPKEPSRQDTRDSLAQPIILPLWLFQVGHSRHESNLQVAHEGAHLRLCADRWNLKLTTLD
jgi:hypothetical protein